MLKNTPQTTSLVIYHSNCKKNIILIDSTIVNGFDIGRVYDNKNVYSEPEFFVAHLKSSIKQFLEYIHLQ